MNEPFDYRIDHKRGCGWRKPGGLYLVSPGLCVPCGKLPLPLEVCPTCSAGIKFSRGWTWLDPRPLFERRLCEHNSIITCQVCPLATPPMRAGLIWIGEQFYPTPQDWEDEARQLGVCRRIKSVPRDFVLGETWVLVAHRKVPLTTSAFLVPAIFHAFRPEAIEYVMRGDESGSELEALKRRGISPVLVLASYQKT
jgi:hypothetical protein